MRCSKDEAMLILSKWLHDSANLILTLRVTAIDELIRLRGQISTLNPDGFLFAGPVGSIHVPFKSATFDYGDVAPDTFAQEVDPRDIRNSLRVQMPMTTIGQDRSANAVLASSLLSITEVVQ
jgi:hypothetical protein